jgi:uncharacterized protein YjiS (DUF1127 family)
MTIQTMFRPTRRTLPSSRVVVHGAKSIVRCFLSLRKRWRAHARIRRELEVLRHLDDHLLRDIGLCRGDVMWVDGVTSLRRAAEFR